MPVLLARPQSAPAAADEVTVLDPVFVDAGTSSPWRHASAPGFEVLSRCSDDFTRDFARALGRSAAARLAVLPRGFWGELPTPMKMVLYDSEPVRAAGRPWGSPIDLAWAPEDGALIGSGAIRHSYPQTLGDGDEFINCGNYHDLAADSATLSVDPDSAILLDCRVPHLPAWFIRGMVGSHGIFPNRRIVAQASGPTVVLPNALWTTTAETVELQDEARAAAEGKKFARKEHPMIALDRLFAGAYPEGQAELSDAEAALLVRWGLFGPCGRKAFLEFVDASTREPPSEDLFRRHLGIGYDEALRDLGAYLPQSTVASLTVPMEEPARAPVRVRDATDAEVARILGAWGQFEGRSTSIRDADYRRECSERADRLFKRVEERREGDPLFLAEYGLHARQSGDNTRAARALGDAARAGVTRPRAYLELARLTLDQALPADMQGVGDLDPASYEAILALLDTARIQMPSLKGSYYLLARVFEHAPTRPKRADLGALDGALALFPQDTALAYQVASTFRRLGYGPEARAAARRAEAFAETDDGRKLIRGFPSD